MSCHNSCLFCRIVNGAEPCYKVLETDEHLAFLSIFPNTEGVTVAIPKAHLPSYAFDVPDEELFALVGFSKKVAKVIDRAFSDVSRTGLIFEGFGIDHLHAKLFPMHGTVQESGWQEIRSDIDTYYDHYPGYLSSHDSLRCDDAVLEAVAARIRDAAKVRRHEP